MRYRKLGRSGLEVSIVSVGTVALGLEYGIKTPGDSGRPPDPSQSIALLRNAADTGINLFDTAPGYGDSEALLGEALGDRAECLIATKIGVSELTADLDGREVRSKIFQSLDRSRRLLRRDQLDLVQIHNADCSTVADSRLIDALQEGVQRGWIHAAGASVYGEESALAAIEHGLFGVVQVAFNLLDQRMAKRVFKAAQQHQVGILARSAFLKGALTPKVLHLPVELTPVRKRAKEACSLFGCGWEALPSWALRFCLSQNSIASVLVGVRNQLELESTLTALSEGPLPESIMEAAQHLSMNDDRLLNPSYWSVP